MPIHPASHVDRPVVDLPLNLTFQCFHINSILKLLNVLLLQQRVVFVSSSYSMLTMITEVGLVYFVRCLDKVNNNKNHTQIVVSYANSHTFVYGLFTTVVNVMTVVKCLTSLTLNNKTFLANNIYINYCVLFHANHCPLYDRYRKYFKLFFYQRHVLLQSFLHFLAPFKWRFTYVPILSNVMLDYVEAPGTFIMGCHSDHLSQVRGFL